MRRRNRRKDDGSLSFDHDTTPTVLPDDLDELEPGKDDRQSDLVDEEAGELPCGFHDDDDEEEEGLWPDDDLPPAA